MLLFSLWSCLKSDSPLGKWQTEIRSGCGIPFVPCPGCLHFLPLPSSIPAAPYPSWHLCPPNLPCRCFPTRMKYLSWLRYPCSLEREFHTSFAGDTQRLHVGFSFSLGACGGRCVRDHPGRPRSRSRLMGLREVEHPE